MVTEPRRVTFYSDRLRLAGLLYLPQGVGPCPGIVLPQGTVGLKEHYRYPKLASLLADKGYAALIFDYRGFGESEAARARLVPQEQVRDTANALTFLSAQPEVASDRLGLVGFCWGGTHAVYLGGTDSRVQCVVEVGGAGNVERWLRGLRPYWEWRDLLHRIQADRARRVMTGASEIVRMGEILIGSPMAKEGRRRILEEIAPVSPPYATPDLSLEVVESMLEYRPEDVVGRLSPRPLMIMHGAEDDLVPLEEATRLYDTAREPKDLVVFPGTFHHEVYLDPLFDEISTRILAWLQRWLNPTSSPDSTGGLSVVASS